MSNAAPDPQTKESVNPVIQKNIHRLLEVRRKEEQQFGTATKVADAITRFTGSMPFLYIHAALVTAWLVINSGRVPGIRPFDPFPFVMLAMIASVEAIFLSTFVLISQNRQAALSDRRAELDLQIGLLTEHEVTRLIQMVHKLLEKEGIPDEWRDLDDLKKEVAPDRVLIEIEQELT